MGQTAKKLAIKLHLFIEHKELERTLDSCKLCIDSKYLEKHAVVATGLKVCQFDDY